MGPVTSREWRWALIVAAVVMLLTTVPYLVALSAQTEQWRFSGFLVGVEDSYSYIAKMGQGARGQWLFTLPYTSEPQRGVILFVFYILLGKVSGPDYTAQVLTFHAARLVFGGALLLVSYRFLAEFLPRVRQRRLGLVLVALGGGLGWLLLLINQPSPFDSLPLELSIPEAYTFLTLYSLPHLAAARALSLLALLAYLRGRGALAGVLLFVVSLIQPIHVLVMWAVMGADSVTGFLPSPRPSPLWGEEVAPKNAEHYSPLPTGDASPEAKRSGEGPGVRASFTAILLSSPLILYTIFIFNTDPLYRQMNAQNVLYSPHPFHYLLGYGLWLLPAALGWRALQRRQPALARFAGAWILIVPVLVYFPVTFQRRMIEAVQLPLVALAVLGLTLSLRRCSRWRAPAVLAASVLTSGFTLATGMLIASSRPEGAFQSADQLAVFDWLAQHAQPGEVGLAAYPTGNALPAYTPLTAYIGLSAETASLAEKRLRVAAFYRSATSDAERLQLLGDGGIRYVLFGPNERALGEFDLEAMNSLQRRFTSGAYSVYEVGR